MRRDPGPAGALPRLEAGGITPDAPVAPPPPLAALARGELAAVLRPGEARGRLAALLAELNPPQLAAATC